MSYAPSGLTILRDVLQVHAPGAFLGIVGDKNHKYGYHLGRDRLPGNDYSNRTARDRAGLTDAAAAIDVGMNWPRSREWLGWLVAECAAGRFGGIREVIGSLDGTDTYCWDQEKNWAPKQRGANDEHTWHTHISVYRDAVNTSQATIITGFFGGAQVPGPPPSRPTNKSPDWTVTIAMNLPSLRRGSNGLAVRRLQALLTAIGHPASIDGDFGPRTEASVRAAQSRYGIGVDGEVGRHTWSVLLVGADLF